MQSGEEKLRIAFGLSSFVNKIKSAGEGLMGPFSF